MRIIALTNCPLDRTLGSGKTVLMWSEGLRALGHEVTVLEPKDYELFPSWRRLRKFRQALGALRVLAERNLASIDLIEFYGDEFWLATWWLSKQRKRPLLVAHTNGLELLAYQQARETADCTDRVPAHRRLIAALTHERFSAFAFRCADRFVTLCRLDQKYVIEKQLQPETRTAVIPPGVDEEYLKVDSCDDKAARIVFFGSWSPRKGLREIRKVITTVLLEYPLMRFEILGASDSEAAIRVALSVLNPERVIIHPRRENSEIARILASSKIMLFPTLYEGFGMALAEAMACGCAVVTTPTGFGGELHNGVEAFVCRFGDADGMVTSIRSLLDDEGLRVAISKAGQRRARRLRWNESVSQLEATYLKWLAQGAT